MTVVLLNGVGSAGKSSIARALQGMTRDVFLHVQMDAFLEMLPAECPGGFSFETIIEDGHPSVVISSGEAGKRAMRGKRSATPDLWRGESCAASKAISSTRPRSTSCTGP